MPEGLKKTGFPDDTRFNIWVVFRSLHNGGQIYAAVPILDVPLPALRALVVPSVWARAIPQLTRHVSRIAMGQELVSIFYWHTATLDETWGFPRSVPEVETTRLMGYLWTKS